MPEVTLLPVRVVRSPVGRRTRDRRVLAVSYVGQGGWRNDEAMIRKGTIEVLETVIRTGIVDRPGQRP